MIIFSIVSFPIITVVNTIKSLKKYPLPEISSSCWIMYTDSQQQKYLFSLRAYIPISPNYSAISLTCNLFRLLSMFWLFCSFMLLKYSKIFKIAFLSTCSSGVCLYRSWNNNTYFGKRYIGFTRKSSNCIPLNLGEQFFNSFIKLSSLCSRIKLFNNFVECEYPLQYSKYFSKFYNSIWNMDFYGQKP